MAEKIEKPKRFTRDWWRYVADYYKVHIIVVIAILVLAGITVYEVSNTVKYDVTLNVVIKDVLPSENAEKLQNNMRECVTDVNADGEKNLAVAPLEFSDTAMQDPNQVNVLYNKLSTLFASEDEMIYVFDEEMLRYVLDMESTEGMFVPVEEWCTEEISSDLLYEYGGDTYAVSLQNSSAVKDAGLKGEVLYVAVRMNYKPDDEVLHTKFQACVSLANALIK